mmetsp:Transcript_63414/g.138091  ORF Transcript_63414/g.138091 Transcript_63414/m.138091 type:complete len:612 (+) Transcript_63414:110-1945(+)
MWQSPIQWLAAVALIVRAIPQTTAYSFAQITDLHLEPFYSPDRGHAKGHVCRGDDAANKSLCTAWRLETIGRTYPFGRLNCDPPLALLTSLAGHMRQVASDSRPDFVLFTGDLPSHLLSCQYHAARTIEYTINFLAKEMLDVAPLFYPVMGNQDYFPDYNVSLEDGNPWQRYVSSLYSRAGVLAGPQLETFSHGGFYAAAPRAGLRLIVLNTIVWSRHVLDWERLPKAHVDHRMVASAPLYSDSERLSGQKTGNGNVNSTDSWAWDQDTSSSDTALPCSSRPRDPYGQFAWLRRQLAEARSAGDRVIFAGHVPPGNKVAQNNFCQSHLEDFENATRDFADIIEVQIYGDHSNDEFRMVWSRGPGEPRAVSSVLISAGVTPRKHCNPSWRMFEVSEDHQVHDFTQYYFPISQADVVWGMNPLWRSLHHRGGTDVISWRLWRKQYSWREQYNTGLQPRDLESLWRRMPDDPNLLRTYLMNMFSLTVGAEEYFDYLCDMRYLSERSNDLCSQKGELLKADRQSGQSLALRGEAAHGQLSTEKIGLELEAQLEAILGESVNGVHSGITVQPAVLGSLVGTCCALLLTTIALSLRLRNQALVRLSSQEVRTYMPLS